MAKDLEVSDHLRKAKWHNDHPKIGNQNLRESHVQSAMLKEHLASQEASDNMRKSMGRATLAHNEPSFAFRSS